ncbi:hypothetical protein JHK85_033089 [Glycine max]|nr:hypothetical protein JHK85_033089 [Glycine max]
MSDLGNLSLSAALKLSHYSSDDALDAPVKTLTNGFDSEPAFETWVLKRTHGSLDRVNKPPPPTRPFQDHLKDPFLKKLFRCVRCKIAFHSKCAPWSDLVLQLKDHLGHAVCWRHPSDWRLDRKGAPVAVLLVTCSDDCVCRFVCTIREGQNKPAKVPLRAQTLGGFPLTESVRRC